MPPNIMPGWFNELKLITPLIESGGKHLCWSLFSTKFHAFRHATLLKRDSNTGVFL